MNEALHRGLLSVFRRLPVRARRRVVRTIAPSFTVGAMCIIERDDGAVLLVEHAYRKRWGVPGGLLERGEEATAAAHREVREEVGIEILLAGEPAVVVDPVPQRVDLVFRATPAAGVTSDDASPRSPEISSVRWFPVDDLPELQHETATALVALARSAHAPQARPAAMPAHVGPAEFRPADVTPADVTPADVTPADPG